MKTLIRAALVAALLSAGLGLAAAPPVAAGPPPRQHVVQVVGDELDPNPSADLLDLSLREAFQLANADAGDSTIILQPGATYALSRCGSPDAQEDLNVDGDLDGPRGGDGDITVQGQGATIRQTCPQERVLHHHDDHLLVLDQVVLTGGDVEAALLGGGGVQVELDAGRLQLHQATVAGNAAFVGGGIYSPGPVEVDDSTLRDNEALLGAGAIGINSSTSSLVIRRSTISHNRADGFGGAVVASGPAVLHDSTVVANATANAGAANLDGSGEWVSRGSIVAAGSGGPDCGTGMIITGDVANLDSDGTCFPNGQHARLHPQLTPLAANGGPTPTYRPAFESPTLDVIPEVQCLYQGDQRGEPRPAQAGGSCDLGSVEQPQTPCATPTFPDVGTQHPFLVDICWLAQTGITNGREDGRFDGGAAVTRQSMAAFLYRFALSPPFEVPAQRTFPDIGANHPFLREIEWLAATEITGGYSDGTYRGGSPVSRQAMAAFLARVANGDDAVPAPPATPTFTDVPTGHPFYAEIEFVAAAGVAGGYEDDTYRGGSPVSRQAMSAFLHRLAKVPNLAGI
jgi:hypothetical protein